MHNPAAPGTNSPHLHVRAACGRQRPMTSPGGRARRPSARRWLRASRDRRHARVSERARDPRPLVRQRLPSGRGAMEQPNITSHGAGVLTARFWVLVALTGVAAGLFGALMMLILFKMEELGVGVLFGALAAPRRGGA